MRRSQSLAICLHFHITTRHCSNLCDARIPLKPHKWSPKSESILLAGSKTQQGSDFKVRGCVSLQLPKISSPSLDNYAGVIAQVFVLGILNAGWHLLWTVRRWFIWFALSHALWCVHRGATAPSLDNFWYDYITRSMSWAGTWCTEVDQHWWQKNSSISLVMSQTLWCMSPPLRSLHWFPVLVVKCSLVVLLLNVVLAHPVCQTWAATDVVSIRPHWPCQHPHYGNCIYMCDLCVCFCPSSALSPFFPSFTWLAISRRLICQYEPSPAQGWPPLKAPLPIWGSDFGFLWSNRRQCCL